MNNSWQLRDGRTIKLLTPAEFRDLPLGTRLVSIFGNEVIKTPSFDDLETRGDYLAYGTIDI